MTAPAEPDYSLMGRLDLYEKAKGDHKAMQQARAAGQPLPATPALNELHRRQKDMTSTTKTKAKTTSGPRVAVQFICNGRVMPDNQNRLSSVAYQYTNGVKDGTPRISSADLKALLTKIGVGDLRTPPWTATLPNGAFIECVAPGTKTAFIGEAKKARAKKAAPAKAPAATKAPAKPKGKVAKQTPGAKARAATKAPAKKTAKQVTPLPKKAAAKKTVAAARAARKTVTKR